VRIIYERYIAAVNFCTGSSTLMSNAYDQDYDSLNEAMNQISTDPTVRQAQLDEIIK
jgi:hypothetical protein